MPMLGFESMDSIIVNPPCKKCEGCPFGGPRVGSKGPLDARIIVVGESPGSEERRKGFPFAGPSGRVLHSIIPEDAALYINALECVPPKSTKKAAKLAQGTKACQQRLLDTIRAHPRKLIVALGNAAIQSLTGDFNLKITQIRGRLIKSELSELGIMPAIHPAALLRGTGSFRQFKEDLTKAWEWANNGLPIQYERPIAVIPRDRGHAMRILSQLRKQPHLTGDIETSSLSPLTGRILCLAIAITGKYGYVFGEEYIDLCKPLLESKRIKWGWHNGKFDIQFFWKRGIQARVDDDTMLMSYALDENPGVHDLETVSSDVLDAPNYKHMLDQYLPTKDTSYEVIPREVLFDYAAIDVGNTARLRKILRARVKVDPRLERLYTKLLIPASKCLGHIETRGIYVDHEEVRRNGERLTIEMQQIREEIWEATGTAINLNSPAQLKVLLYEQLKYPNRFKGSTDEDALDALPQTPIIVALKKYRKIAKQYGTYVQSLLGREGSKGVKAKVAHVGADGRVHATYLIHGTVTGRLASRKPNMQNIPRDSTIRGQFTAAPGYVLMECDLSQAELRSLACMSGDPRLIAIFLSGEDLHGTVAEYFWGANYTDEQRVLAKNVNFGIIYGITGAGLAEQTGLTVVDATHYINMWYQSFPVAAAFIRRCRDTVGKMQVMSTAFGRLKRVGLVTKMNMWGLANEAANFPHQSTASDITLTAAIEVQPKLMLRDIWIVNLIHDAILLEVPDRREHIAYAARLTTQTMQQVPTEEGLKRVPFLADVKVGKRWGSLSKIKPGGDYSYLLEVLK
jgi:DNA polymerase-1